MASIEITTKIGCKIACLYCPQDKIIDHYKKRSHKFILDFDQFKVYITRIPLQVDIKFGGMSEPWLNPDCTKMMLHTHERGHRIGVKTTLVGLTLSDIDLLEQLPFTLFIVHLPSERGREQICVDDEYLSVLKKLADSSIDARYHYHGGALNSKVKLLLKSMGKKGELWPLHSRAGNIKAKHRLKLPGRRGAIGCQFHLCSNYLLPNGDVVLCSNDYGMKHVLGNLISSSYDSLFKGEEYKKILKGQKDESLDVLCRNCDSFCINLDLAAKVFNWKYGLNHLYFNYMAGFRNLGDLYQIMLKAVSALKKRTQV